MSSVNQGSDRCHRQGGECPSTKNKGERKGECEAGGGRNRRGGKEKKKEGREGERKRILL